MQTVRQTRRALGLAVSVLALSACGQAGRDFAAATAPSSVMLAATVPSPAPDLGLPSDQLQVLSQEPLNMMTASGDDPEGHPAAAMISSFGRDAMAVLADASLNAVTREEYFRDLLARNLDINTIGKFVAGRHWRRADAAQREAYLKAFRSFILAVSARQLGGAQIADFQVIGVREGKRSKVLVKSVMMRRGKPVTIVWLLRPRDDKFLVIDMAVEGVSMAMTRRQEFNSIIRAAGSAGIDGLTNQLSSYAAET